MTTLMIPGYTSPPLSLNDRTHWAKKARISRELRNLAHALARSEKVPACDFATITLHYLPAQKRRRDDLNLMATLKPLVDGLVDAGCLPDDDTSHVATRVQIHEPDKHATVRLWLSIQPEVR